MHRIDIFHCGSYISVPEHFEYADVKICPKKKAGKTVPEDLCGCAKLDRLDKYCGPKSDNSKMKFIHEFCCLAAELAILRFRPHKAQESAAE